MSAQKCKNAVIDCKTIIVKICKTEKWNVITLKPNAFKLKSIAAH